MRIFFIAVVAALLLSSAETPACAATAAKASAPVDITGYWVAFVTEDWRFRMITPRKGDYQPVPMTPEARKVADAWDPAADEASGNQCKSYGAGALMRLAARFHITWQDDNTLRVESDAGTQTRLFHFDALAPQGERSWQGNSSAQWEKPSSLKVVTNNLRSGYLRKNGVPYSENAVVTEYFDIAPIPGGGQVLLVTAIVDDPQFLRQPFTTSSQFKKEPDGSKWDPTPCTAK
ncbi:MAG TPA: hypothetical protein VK686_11780 [Bryobacteraceae bacterium]|jgi:hypothetical protein|nr:hypothetical protein [Bryobacteraceae bacterium]